MADDIFGGMGGLLGTAIVAGVGLGMIDAIGGVHMHRRKRKYRRYDYWL
jgi:hypothetical protein